MKPKRLFLLRHAKSFREDPFLDDFDRPLNKRGQRAAHAMAEWLAARNLHPDLVLCSAAARTRETLAAVRPALGATTEIRIEKSLYLADEETILDVLAALDESPQPPAQVMVIAHNPGLEDLALRLVPPVEIETRRRIATKFPTCAFVDLSFAVEDWADIGPARASLNAYLAPTDIG
ncbi:MAG: histidine phosphatase family protein [Proteobacteria bacterium]|nr:histidine phosphatase family protein [Pseudomonadota bacterium]